MSEILVAKLNNNQNTASGAGNWRNSDWRGHVWHDVLMSSQSQCPGIFMTINGPNSSVPDNGLCGIVPNNDPLMPCINGAATARVNTARSRHSGGVNASFADGSIRFMTNTINLTAWNALGTMDGGEPISEFE